MSNSSKLGFQFSLLVIPAPYPLRGKLQQESKIISEMQKLLDTRLRGYDRLAEFIFLNVREDCSSVLFLEISNLSKNTILNAGCQVLSGFQIFNNANDSPNEDLSL